MEWLASITTTGIFAIVIWLSRNLITTRLTQSVKHEFDSKLELLRSDLRTQDTEIATLRIGAMTAMSSRKIALDKQKLDAIDKLWAQFLALKPARNIFIVLLNLDKEAVSKQVPFDKELREFFKILGTSFDIDKYDASTSEKERPFVSSMAWALFAAYQTIVMQTIGEIKLFEAGIDNKKLINRDGSKQLVKAALPSYEAYIEENGEKCYHFLINILENNFLDEIKKMLAGEEDDKQTVEQAGKINKIGSSRNRVGGI